jgi:hypothetical protein
VSIARATACESQRHICFGRQPDKKISSGRSLNSRNKVTGLQHAGLLYSPSPPRAGWLVRLRLHLGTSGGAGPRSSKPSGPSGFRASDQMKSEATGIAIGVVIGVATGAFLEHMAMSIAIGIALGIAAVPVIKGWK